MCGGGEWKEAHEKLEEKKQELSRQIDLSWGFGELGGKLVDFEEDKIWTSNGGEERREKLQINYP